MDQSNIAENFVRDTLRPRAIEQLRSFCRGEMSAVETYRQAIQATRNERVRARLRRNLASHIGRVQLLRRRIAELGGQPPESSGPWGAFAKVVEGAASAIGDKPALTMLAEGESYGLSDYRAELGNLDFDSQELVSAHILPQQIQTQTALVNLKRSLS